MPLLAIANHWWLPPNYSVHGRETDALFYWFFWITFSILVVVQILLVVFLLKYRTRPGRRALFVHGNSRLEMVWTAIPTIILAVLALGSKRVWDDYRNSPSQNDPNKSTVLVIGQQFKWTVIYPGPDGKFGRYLIYPKPTDKVWPLENGVNPKFQGVTGPALAKDPVSAVGTYIDQDTAHRLGKDFSDPNGPGADDVVMTEGATIEVPVNRPVEVLIESKDVIHDFYLPNFRAQLYAVPGMRGQLVFTPTVTTAELEKASRKTLDVATLHVGPDDNLKIDIDADSPGADLYRKVWRYSVDKKKKDSIIRDQGYLVPETLKQLQAIGVQKITVHTPQPFEVVCAQLCGEQHSEMKGSLVVLSQEEFDKKHPAAPHAAAAVK